MGIKLPAVKPKEVVKALRKVGFVEWRQKGSHLSLFRASDQAILTIAIHYGATVPKGTLHEILKQAKLELEDFLKLI